MFGYIGIGGDLEVENVLNVWKPSSEPATQKVVWGNW